MLKKIVFAVLPMTLFAVSGKADDGLSIDASTIQDVNASLVENEIDIDSDALSKEVESAGVDEEEALEACFRRFGYRRFGWGFGQCYRPYYRTCFTYRPYYHCAPVYRCMTPIYRYYWGCY